MRKILFFIILIPFFMTLGHDLYMFYSKPETRFRFSDVGFLWSKYHRESHDQWKSVFSDIGDQINETIETIETIKPVVKHLPEPTKAIEPEKQEDQPTYGESFTQVDERKGPVVNVPTEQQRDAVKRVEGAKNLFGTLLECRAVFVTGGFALLVFLINTIFFRAEKETKIKPIGRRSHKGGYTFTRK